MINWNSGKLKVIVELSGAAAVLLGLVFVGLELRQNTAAIQASTFQSQIDAGNQWLADIYTNPEVADAWFTALSDPAQLDEKQAQLVTYIVRAQWFNMQNAYSQWRRRSLTDDDWFVYEKLICREPSPTPSGAVARLRQTSWGDHREALTEAFVSFVEGCGAASP